MVAERGVWRQFFAFVKTGIFGEELGLQDPQPVELGKQKTGSLRHRTQRIFWMRLLPGRELLLRGIKIQVVGRQVSALQRGRLRAALVGVGNTRNE